MQKCSCLVGNSSSGIREGAFLGTPVVNIGSRQDKRERGKNVIDSFCCASEIEKPLRNSAKVAITDISQFMETGLPENRSLIFYQSLKI